MTSNTYRWDYSCCTVLKILCSKSNFSWPLQILKSKPILIVGFPGGGGGGHSSLNWVGGCRWGGKNLTLSQTAQRTKIHPVTIYLTKTFICIPCCKRWFKVRWDWYGRTLYSAVYHHTFINICCVPHAPSPVPRSRACHKHCGLGSNRVINGVTTPVAN